MRETCPLVSQTDGLLCHGDRLLSCGDARAAPHADRLSSFARRGFNDSEVERALRSFDFSTVDCWVYVESFDDDLRRCLRRYERASGARLDWALLAELLTRPRQNPTDHASCAAMVDRDLGALLYTKEAAMFDRFGYTSCCGPPTTRPLRRQERSTHHARTL